MSLDPRVFSLLERWEALHHQGQAPTPEELCADCPDLLGEVRRHIDGLHALQPMLDTTDGGGLSSAVPYPASPSQAAEATAAGTRYRPLRFHAKGGLGEVHVAADTELNREVALKRIQAHRAHDPESRRRFLREAEVTGRLEHPGVVPVYGLVHDDDGEPCYAMRFIEGETLHDAIQRFHQADKAKRDPGERRVEFRGLLARFVAVCNTVAYAHSRGVLHRDLKPANVMLGKYGETLVVDWGLARPLGRSEGEPAGGEDTVSPTPLPDAEKSTATGQPMGTPAYMSPEQAQGRWDKVGPASDVYCLGATLYALLAGRPPFGRDSEFRLIREGQYTPLRQVKGDVPRPLEAICRKAMALRPAERYTTARDLANDIDKWLADEAVGAYREPVSSRLARWGRRHRPVVTGAAALLVTAVIALAISTVLIREREQAARTARRDADEARELAEQREREADRERAVAQAVSTFLQHDLLGQADIGNQMSRDGQAVRNPDIKVRELLDRAAAVVGEKFPGQPEVEAVVRQTIGDAYRALGEYDRAQEQLEQAVARKRQRFGADHLSTLAAQNSLALLYEARGEYDRAEALLQKALQALTAELGADHPDTLAVKTSLANLCRTCGEYDRAEALLREVLRASTAKLGADHPDTLLTKSVMAALYQSQAKYDRAEALLREVLRASTAKLGADHPDTLSTKNNLATLYVAQREYGQAEPLFREVAQVFIAKLGADHPKTAGAKSNLAAVYFHQRKYDHVEPLLEEVVPVLTGKLGPDHPDTLSAKTILGAVYHSRKKYSQSETCFQDVVQGFTAKLGPDHPSTLTAMASLAQLYRDQGKYDRAEPLCERVLTGRKLKLGDNHPDTLKGMTSLATVYLATERPEKALPLIRDFVAGQRQRLGREDFSLAGTLSKVGQNLLKYGQFAEAEKMMRESLAIREAKLPDDWTTFYARSQLGGSLLNQKQYAVAEPLLIAGYEGMKQREAKIQPPYRVHLSEAAGRLVHLYDAWGKKAQAERWRKELDALRTAPENGQK